MRYIRELIDKEGNIIRVGITDHNILKVTRSSVKYINKTLTEEKIMKMYNSYKDSIIEKRKGYVSKTGRLCALINLTIIPYNKFRQIIIDDCQLAGILYQEEFNKLSE